MASNRHLGRIVALQSLYEYEFRIQLDDPSVDIDEILTRNLERYDTAIEDKTFVTKLVKGVLKVQSDLDAKIAPIAPDWPIDQIARINEAVELAKAFGSDNSSKFVNGVLGTAYRTLVEDTTNGTTSV
jgi:N utilization substance protein B